MIKIEFRVWQKLLLAAQHNTGLEVAGFAKASIVDGAVVITDILIPPQEVGAAHADMGADQLDWLAAKIIARGDTAADWFGTICWWHSHVDMATSPSSIDQETLMTLAKQSQNGCAVGLIINKRGEAFGWAVFQSSLLGAGHYVEQTLEVAPEKPIDNALLAEVAEMMAVVTTKPLPLASDWQPQSWEADRRRRYGLPLLDYDDALFDEITAEEFHTLYSTGARKRGKSVQ